MIVSIRILFVFPILYYDGDFVVTRSEVDEIEF
jgi:hypothetical protein